MASSRDSVNKLFALIATTFLIEIVLFKFTPDISIGAVQHSPPTLSDFDQFKLMFMTPPSVHCSGVFGNHILFYLALFLSKVTHFADVRLHPLRLAAGIVTPIYVYLGMHFVFWRRSPYSWPIFWIAYSVIALTSLYQFAPYDLSSLAFLSASLFFILEERLGLALCFMLICGLFRESSFHAVWFVACWALCSRGPTAKGVLAAATFCGLFILEIFDSSPFFSGANKVWAGRSSRVVLRKRGNVLDHDMQSGSRRFVPSGILVQLRPPEQGRLAKQILRLQLRRYVFPAGFYFTGNLPQTFLNLEFICQCFCQLCMDSPTI